MLLSANVILQCRFNATNIVGERYRGGFEGTPIFVRCGKVIVSRANACPFYAFLRVYRKWPSRKFARRSRFTVDAITSIIITLSHLNCAIRARCIEAFGLLISIVRSRKSNWNVRMCLIGSSFCANTIDS